MLLKARCNCNVLTTHIRRNAARAARTAAAPSGTRSRAISAARRSTTSLPGAGTAGTAVSCCRN
jgi:hypothetical protein